MGTPRHLYWILTGPSFAVILPLMTRLHMFNDDIYAPLLLDLSLICVVTLAFLLCWTDPQVVLPLYPAVEDVVADEHVPTDHVRNLVPVLRVHAHTCTVHTSRKAGVLKEIKLSRLS
jgi:hypothetical protein